MATVGTGKSLEKIPYLLGLSVGCTGGNVKETGKSH